MAWKAIPEDLISMPIPAKYDPSAKCPEFIRFLKDVMATDDYILSCIDFMASLLISQAMDLFICAPGNGSNGRSTLKDTISAFVGEDAVRRIPLSDLKHRFTNGFLKKERVNYCSETEVSAIALDHIKRSGERMAVEVKFGGMQTVPLFLKHFFDTNPMPRIAENSFGADRRLTKLDCPWQFVEEPEEGNVIQKRKDPDILSKLTTPTELSGILNLVLLRTPVVIKKKMIHRKPEGLAEYGLQSRSCDVFIDIFVDVTTNEDDKVHSNILRDAYKQYCSITNSASLTSKGFKTVLEDKTHRFWTKSVRIDDTVNSGYTGLAFNETMFNETIAALKKAREEGKPMFPTLFSKFPSLGEDYSSSKQLQQLHNNYTNNIATDVVCSLCSKCSCNIDSLAERKSKKKVGNVGEIHQKELAGSTTTTKLQTQSCDTGKCSTSLPTEPDEATDTGSKIEKTTTNVVVEEYLRDGGQASLKRFIEEFPEAA